MYPRVISFDALNLCTHRITFVVEKLNCLVVNQSILFGRSENIFFVLKYRGQRVLRVPPLFCQTPISTPFIGC